MFCVAEPGGVNDKPESKIHIIRSQIRIRGQHLDFLSIKSLISLVMGSWHILIVIPGLSLSTASLVMFMMHTSQTEKLSRSEIQREDLNRFNWMTGGGGTRQGKHVYSGSRVCHSAVLKRIVSSILLNNCGGWQKLSVIFYELIPKSVRTKFMCSLMWLDETWRGDSWVCTLLSGARLLATRLRHKLNFLRRDKH